MRVQLREDTGILVKFENEDDSKILELKIPTSTTSFKVLYEILESETKSKHFDIFFGDLLLNRGSLDKLTSLKLEYGATSVTSPFTYKYNKVALSVPEVGQLNITSNTTVYELLKIVAAKKGCEVAEIDGLELKTNYQFEVMGDGVKRTKTLTRTPSSSPVKQPLQRRVSMPRNRNIEVKHISDPSLSFSISVEGPIGLIELKQKLAEKLNIKDCFDIYKQDGGNLENDSIKGGTELKYAYKEITLVINGIETKVRLDNKIWEIKVQDTSVVLEQNRKQIEGFEAQVKELTQQMEEQKQAAEQEKAAVQKQVEREKAAAEQKANEAKEGFEAKIGELQQAKQDVEGELEKVKGQLKDVQEENKQIAQLQEANEKLKQAMESQKQAAEEAKAQAQKQVEREKVEAEQKANEAKEGLQAKIADLEEANKGVQGELKGVKAKLAEVQEENKQIGELKGQIEKLQQEMESQKQASEEEKAEVQKQVEREKAEAERKANEAKEGLQAKIADLEEANKGVENELGQIKTQLEAAQKENSKIGDLKGQIEQLKQEKGEQKQAAELAAREVQKQVESEKREAERKANEAKEELEVKVQELTEANKGVQGELEKVKAKLAEVQEENKQIGELKGQIEKLNQEKDEQKQAAEEAKAQAQKKFEREKGDAERQANEAKERWDAEIERLNQAKKEVEGKLQKSQEETLLQKQAKIPQQSDQEIVELKKQIESQNSELAQLRAKQEENDPEIKKQEPKASKAAGLLGSLFIGSSMCSLSLHALDQLSTVAKLAPVLSPKVKIAVSVGIGVVGFAATLYSKSHNTDQALTA